VGKPEARVRENGLWFTAFFFFDFIFNQTKRDFLSRDGGNSIILANCLICGGIPGLRGKEQSKGAGETTLIWLLKIKMRHF